MHRLAHHKLPYPQLVCLLDFKVTQILALSGATSTALGESVGLTATGLRRSNCGVH